MDLVSLIWLVDSWLVLSDWRIWMDGWMGFEGLLIFFELQGGEIDDLMDRQRHLSA
jgi:hypothetical protein